MASNSGDHRFLSIASLKRCYLSRKLYRFTTSTTNTHQLKVDPYLPVQLLELVFRHVSSLDDRNAVSLVSKSWYEAERFSRQKVVVTNCDAIDPQRLTARFPRLTSLTVKGRVGHWGNDLCPWIKTMVAGGVDLEELRVKRMVVSEETLTLISRSFPNLKSLVLISCHNISTDGLAAIVSNCRSLTEFDVQSAVIDDNEHWLSGFPDSCTTLVSLNFADLPGKVSTEALERLVARCPNLTSLRLNHRVSLDVLLRILVQAPHLVDLGVGSFCGDPVPVHLSRLLNVLQKCTSIRSLSGFMSKVDLLLLPAILPICQSLTSLDLSRSTLLNTDKSLICGRELKELIRHCPKLERLWVRGAAIGDEGLAVVASTCKELQELRILPNFQAFVTEKGLVAVSAGCPKLKSVYYTCKEITNAALITIAKNCPNLTCFMLHDHKNRIAGDIMTMYPLDEGFEAIVQSCKGLKKLRLCGFITDQVFMSIGMYAQQLEKLTIPFAEDSEYGILYVLNGCKKLKELNINNSRFGNKGLLAGMSKYETLRSLCMKSCQVTLEGCEQLAQRMPRLNVETNGERKSVYRTLVGPRKDAPPYVRTL